MSNVSQRAESIETELMGQLMMESMASFDYSPEHSVSDTETIAALQQQYGHFCMKAKSNLVIDKVQPGPQTKIVTFIKNSVKEYIEDENNRSNRFMHWLYDSSDDDVITQQIKMLTKGLIYKEYENVANADKRKSLDPEQVSSTISILVYFVILANSNYNADDFNRLFVETWFDYYENWMATELMFQMNGGSWREQFKGVLLFD